VSVLKYVTRPVWGPGPGRQIKKIELEKKGCPRERNLRERYTENSVGTEFCRYDATGGGGGRKNFLGPGA